MSKTEKFKTNLPSMQHKRYGCAAVALGGQIFVLGGRKHATGEIYHASRQKWIILNSQMSTARGYGAAVSLGDSIIVMGGHDGGDPFSSVEEYDTISQQWSCLPSMNSKRSGCAASVLGGKIIVVGGRDDSGYLACGEEYDPTTQQWSRIPPMHTKRLGCAVAVSEGQLYVFGGCGGNGNDDKCILSSTEVYNPKTKEWALVAELNTARWGCAAVSSGGKIFVVGGWNKEGIELSSCETYSTTTHQWSSIASMHTKRAYCAAVEVEGTLYVMGGDDGRKYLSSMESLQIQPSLSK